MFRTPLLPSPHQESAPLGDTFTLPAMNGPLPAELKFRGDTVMNILLQSPRGMTTILNFRHALEAELSKTNDRP